MTPHRNASWKSILRREQPSCSPGIVLDELNRQLKDSGWHFPSTSPLRPRHHRRDDRQQLAGTRSIKYGIMVHNVLEVEAVLAARIAHRVRRVA